MRIKQINKCFALILSAFMMLSSVNVVASAELTDNISYEDIAPAYEYSDDAQSMLSISSNTASCTSSCTGAKDVIQITVEQTLQKHAGMWAWNNVNGAIWSTTEKGSYISVDRIKRGLSGGTYRLKSVFTLTTKMVRPKQLPFIAGRKQSNFRYYFAFLCYFSQMDAKYI